MPSRLAPVELLGGPYQAEYPLLDQVQQREIETLKAARIRDHQAQVGVDQAFLSRKISPLDAPGELGLLSPGEQPVAPNLGHEQRHRGHRSVGRLARPLSGCLRRSAFDVGLLTVDLDPTIGE